MIHAIEEEIKQADEVNTNLTSNKAILTITNLTSNL